VRRIHPSIVVIGEGEGDAKGRTWRKGNRRTYVLGGVFLKEDVVVNGRLETRIIREGSLLWYQFVWGVEHDPVREVNNGVRVARSAVQEVSSSSSSSSSNSNK